MPRTYPGTCMLCGRPFRRAAMKRHLEACPSETGGPTTAYHLLVEARNNKCYWLHLAVPVTAKLEVLDDFLRDFWLECCGHLSVFSNGRLTYSSSPEMEDLGMRVPLSRVMYVGTKLRYEYDFGSTTELAITVLGLREMPGKEVLLLARNNQPEIACETCGAPATQICSVCSSEGKGWVCDSCATVHECGEGAMLPNVNSPRVGICAYSG